MGNNRLWGGEGNVTLIASEGNDAINGNWGFDIAKFSGDRSEYQIDKSSSQITITNTVLGRDGSDALYSIEKAEFKDGSLILIPAHSG
jgi:hypothetical protein